MNSDSPSASSVARGHWPPRGQLLPNHVNLTVTPPAYLRCLRRFPRVINAGFTDTAKSKYCHNLLRGHDGYDGPVIVKTDLNFGGRPEQNLHRRREQAWPRRLLRLFGRPVAASGELDPYAYPIYDSPSLVPFEVWSDPSLVVQKFQPEKDEISLYRLRSWYVLGDHGFHVVTSGREPIVKDRNTLNRQVADIATPPDMEALRRALHVDYGRFDYGLVEGKPWFTTSTEHRQSPPRQPSDTLRSGAASRKASRAS